MSTSLTHMKASEPIEQIAAALMQEGAVIVEGLLTPELLARFNREIDPLVGAAAPDHDSNFINESVAWFFGDKTRHVTGMAGKSSIFASEILTHPVYRGVCDFVLLPSCARYQLNLAHLLDRGPGSDQQLLHRDEAVWIHLQKPHPEVMLASIVALVDFTADNGATRIAPGSHRWPEHREPVDAELAAAEMPAGSAVIYLGSTIHAGGANVTPDTWRRGMHVSYAAGWLRTEENQYLSTPLDVVRQLPRASQELLGFAAHDAIDIGGGYLGTVELQDPLDLLERGEL